MVGGHPVPDEPLLFIQECARRRRVLWTHHVNMRLRGRFISREAILKGAEGYQMVEEYPRDKYLPSYLILGRAGQDAYHVVFAVDVDGNNVRVVTAYRPDRMEWSPDLKSRRARE